MRDAEVTLTARQTIEVAVRMHLYKTLVRNSL